MRLEDRLQAFDETRHGLLDEMEGLDPALLVAKPIPGKWSMIEIVEHLVLAELAVLRGLPDPSLLVEKNRDVGNRVRYVLVLFILTSGIPVRTPSPAMVPQGDRSLAELRRLWDESQRWLRSCIAHLGPGAGRKAVFEHPIAGPLTVSQAVRMGQVHVDGHARQLRRLRRLLA
jgi:hypothetical protein